MAFTLPFIFKANPRQPSSFDDDFEDEAEAYDPPIAVAESSGHEGDADVELKRSHPIFTTEGRTPETLSGTDGQETNTL